MDPLTFILHLYSQPVKALYKCLQLSLPQGECGGATIKKSSR